MGSPLRSARSADRSTRMPGSMSGARPSASRFLQSLGPRHDCGDEAEFWETRDLKVLAENINESTAFIAQFHDALKGALGDRTESPIEACRNIVRI